MATQTIAAYDLNYSSKKQQILDRNLHLFAAQQRARRGPTPEVFCCKRWTIPAWSRRRILCGFARCVPSPRR
jgi:hypothetical protein